MESLTDQQLLRDYTERQSESAFAELVRRHIALVYSAALRMVCDAHLAEDVTQGVFVALARSGPQLAERPVLAGWLHRTAQNIAGQTVRTEVRRRTREQEVAAMSELLSAESDTGWEALAPHLDAALGELNESERDAVLLRYFERKSAREMAHILGVRDEAAQKRVSRGVESLRTFLAKRGVTVGASGLVVLISANAVQSAPVGLALNVSAAALAGTTIASTVAATTTTLAMTSSQKSLIAISLVTCVSVGFYETRQAALVRDQVQTLRQQQAPLTEQLQQLQHERDETARQLASLREENERLNRATAELLKLRAEVGALRSAAKELKPVESDPTLVAAKSWLEKVNVLKKWVEQRPEQQIPEFQYLHDYDWLDAVKGSDMIGDYAPRNAMAGLREAAKNQFAHEMSNALKRFVEKHNGDLPTDLSQLNAYFQQPMSDTILRSYKLLRTGKLADLPKNEWIVGETAPPFDEHDSTSLLIGIDNWRRALRER